MEKTKFEFYAPHYIYRVSKRKSESMQNEFFSVFSSRSILDMMETIPQIGKAPKTLRECNIKS